MSLSPYMGAPQSAQGGLLGAAQGYSYPLTSGLLGAIGSAGGVAPFAQQVGGAPNYWTQQALSLAGNPHAGPYANAPALGTTSGSGTPTGSYPVSTGSQLEGSLLGIAKNIASPNSPAGQAIRGLLSPNLSSTSAVNLAANASADSGAATSAVGSQLGNVASDGTAAQVAAANQAALAATDGGSLGASAGLLSNPDALAAAGDYTGAAGAAAAQQLGNAANDGTGAAVQASNDAALNATDGGAAGAGAGYSGALGDASTALGALGAAYSLYNTVNNYQSGNTGSDAMNGAETGASIGTMVVPGIGTAIGGLIGGAAGALSSAFGGGENDPETQIWDKVAQLSQTTPGLMSELSPNELYQNLAGVMDAKDNSPGHSQPIEQVFGRGGEGNLMDQLTGFINQQYKSGKLKPGESIQDQWTQAVAPWLASKNASIANQNTAKGTPEGPALTADIQGLLQDWENGSFNAQTPMGLDYETISGLPTFAGLTPEQMKAIQAQQQAVAQRNDYMSAISPQSQQRQRGLLT